MKPLKVALITLVFLFCWMGNGYADRLCTWTDAKGVTHITFRVLRRPGSGTIISCYPVGYMVKSLADIADIRERDSKNLEFWRQGGLKSSVTCSPF